MGWRLLALCRNVKDPRADAFRFVRQVLASNDKRWGRGTGGFIPGRQTLGSNDAVYRLWFFAPATQVQSTVRLAYRCAQFTG